MSKTIAIIARRSLSLGENIPFFRRTRSVDDEIPIHLKLSDIDGNHPLVIERLDINRGLTWDLESRLIIVKPLTKRSCYPLSVLWRSGVKGIDPAVCFHIATINNSLRKAELVGPSGHPAFLTM